MITKNGQLNRRATLTVLPAAVSAGSDALVDEYLEWKKSYTKSAAQSYEIWVRRFQCFANKPPEEFVVADWLGFEALIRDRFSRKTVQYALIIIHNYLRYWHEQKRLPRFELYYAKVPRACSKSHNAVTEDEYAAMVRVLRSRGGKGLRDLAVVMLLHDTGMRVGELAQLEIDQIEEGATAEIRTEKTIRNRRVFWSELTDDVVNALIVERVNSRAETDWLFVAGKGKPERRLLTRNVQRMVRQVAKEAGITRKISPHSFRHALVHRLAKLGVPDAIIAGVVGHSSPVSISHYTKLSRPEYQEVARRQFEAFALAA